uniref:Uncharacterized protein n=1 Tax=Wolbachia endosymbiont of Aleurodicus floccissimus TaxID=2152762 RepID=A0A3B0IX25_9RICK
MLLISPFLITATFRVFELLKLKCIFSISNFVAICVSNKVEKLPKKSEEKTLIVLQSINKMEFDPEMIEILLEKIQNSLAEL